MNHHSGVLEAYQHHHSFGLDQKTRMRNVSSL